ncbi:MAG: DUF4386 family protein [Thermoplasmata archaeon]|nr:DUF4386 family protein [Thermoplasmata archaeon]
MNGQYYRKTAALVGVLFIIATVTAISAMVLLGTAFEEPDFIVDLPEIENKVVTAVLLELVLAISLICIGALMFPVFKKHGEGMAVGYASIRLVEAIFIIIASVCLLAMLTMGEGYASGDLDATGAEAMGALLMGLREWAFVIGTLVFLGLGAVVLNYLFYVSRLIPRWLSVWGLIGGAGVLIYGGFALFGHDISSFSAVSLLAAPIAVQEMVFAVFLMVKGFDAPADE